MENLILAINCVLPVFLVICSGSLIRRSHIVPEETFPALSKISFQFLLPCMLFHSTYTTDLSSAFDPALLGFLAAALLIWYCVGFALCTRFIPDHRVRGVFIQTFFRSNIGVVGVSMAESMMGDFGVASMAMAIARDSDHELTGQVVVTTSFFCCLTLFLWIFCLGQVGLI